MRKRKKRYMKPAAFLLAATLLFGSITPVYGAEESPIVKTEAVENTENTEKPDGNMEQSGGSMDEPDENVDEPGGEESGNPDGPDENVDEPGGEESGNPDGPDENVDEPEGEESGDPDKPDENVDEPGGEESGNPDKPDGNAGQSGEPEDGEIPSGDASGIGEGAVTGEEGGEGLPEGEGEENVPTPDGEKCICTEPCTEEAVNEECPVCGAEGADLSLCEGKAEEEEKCICTVACTEESRNEECPICGAEDADLTCCLGKKEETKQTGIEIEEVMLIETGGEGEEDHSAVIGSTGQAGFNIQVRLSGPESETVTLGYRFTIPKASDSGGEWNYGTGTYQWLTAFDGSAPEIVEKDGNLIIEGKVEARSGQGNVVPGIYLSSITVTGKNLVNEEKANLTVECWVYEEGEGSGTKSAYAEISVESRSKFSLTDKVNGGAPTISGYFNKTTGKFYVSRPEDGEDYAYGRVVMFRILAWNDSTSERPDPTQPISFDFSYDVQLNVDGKLMDVTESDEQPVLMAVKRADEEVKSSQLATTPVQDDVTLGGLIEDNSNRTGPGNVGFYHGGDYTFQKNDDGSVHVKAVLSADNKNSGYRHAAIWGIIFVPLSQEDPEGSYRQLNIRAYDLNASSYGGGPIEVTQAEILQWYKINPDISEGASIEGLFSRQIRVGSTSVVKREESVTVKATVNNVDPLNIADYDIRAINVLTKFDTDGYECNSYPWWDAPMRTGFVGEEAVLYAVKKDGTGWSSEYEMNHTKDDELLYYDDYQTPAKEGKKIVGILMELRGKWVSGSALTKPSTLKVIGDGGEAYAIVQDVKIWRGKDVASWKGTDGEKLQTLPVPDDKMFPYDNPSNKEGVYRKDTWPENEPLPIETEGHTWGDTLYVIGGSIKKLKNETVNLNGHNIGTEHGPANERWSSSTYDTTLNERIVDEKYTFEVSGVGEKKLELGIELFQIYDSTTGISPKPYGKVLLSTLENPVTYVPNEDPGQPGTFLGGIDITDQLDSFTVPGDGTYSIYFQGYIGDASDLSKDVTNGIWWHYATLSLKGDSARYVINSAGDAAWAINVNNSGSVAVSKQAVSETAGDRASWQLSFTSSQVISSGMFLMDVLPYNGDGRGSSFHGSYTIEGNELEVMYSSAGTGDEASQVELFYTTDAKVRGSDAEIFNDRRVKGNSFQAGGVLWEKAEEKEKNIWTVSGNDVPTAIVLYGTVEVNERVAVTINLKLNGQQAGDVYANTCSSVTSAVRDPFTSNTATVTAVGITVAPADITIYMGGEDGHEGVVDEDGQIVSNTTLPEPGFTVTLPEELKSQGVKAIELTFQEAEGGKSWRLVPYDGREETEVYKLVPAEGQEAVRVEFTDAEGHTVISDHFTVGTDVNASFAMKLYKGEGSDAVGDIVAEYGGTCYSVNSETKGTLIVRGTTSKAEYAEVQPEGTPAEAGKPALTAPEDTVYTINDGDVQVTEEGKVSLLFDRIIDTGGSSRTDALWERAEAWFAEQEEKDEAQAAEGTGKAETGPQSETERKYEFRYLDLVDRNNGDAWVRASKDVTISWPLPEGTDGDTVFTVLHFKGLHREMGSAEMDAAIAGCQVEKVSSRVQDGHVVFAIGSGGFSPFALVWEEEKESPETPSEEPSETPSENPGEEKPQENSGNTPEGGTENQASGEQTVKSEPEEKEWFPILSNLFPDGEEQDETSPGTGDAAAPVLWAGILAASAAVIFLLIHAERKAAGKKKREQRKRD